jgi:hypothetical protein
VISGDEFGQHPASRNLVVRLTFIYAARSIVIIRWSPCRPEPGRSQSTQHSSGLWPGLSCHGNISRKSSLDWGFYHSPTLRRPNAELRTREYLTAAEIESLIEAAKGNRRDHVPPGLPAWAARRRGLRPALGPGRLQRRRPARAGGQEHGQHPPPARRRTPGPAPAPLESETSPFVFVSERGSPFTTAGFARMVERAAVAAGLEMKAHPHMLRHACGYALANKGHDTRAIQGWLGHRSITSTAVYTALAPNRFKHFLAGLMCSAGVGLSCQRCARGAAKCWTDAPRRRWGPQNRRV